VVVGVAAQDDIEKFDQELKLVEESTALYTDSSRIHGAPQRYLTRYLRVQLKRERERQEVLLTRMKNLVGGGSRDASA
jgi:hypothetical protein